MFSADLAVREHDRVVVVLCGELDAAAAATCRGALMAAVAACPLVIADLADLEFIDCAGLGALVRARNLARRADGDLMLAAARGRVHRVLTLTGLATVFTVCATVTEATGSPLST
jgi:anti-anti-sigma factor